MIPLARPIRARFMRDANEIVSAKVSGNITGEIYYLLRNAFRFYMSIDDQLDDEIQGF